MRMQYVLKPLALSVLAAGLLFTGTPAVQAAPDKNGQQNYKQSGDRDAKRGNDRVQSNDRKDKQDRRDQRDQRNGQRNDKRDDKRDDRRDYRNDGRMERGHDNRSEQGERMGKPQYDKDKGDRRSSRGDEMGRPRDDRRPPRDMQQRDSQKGQRPAARPADNDDDVRN